MTTRRFCLALLIPLASVATSPVSADAPAGAIAFDAEAWELSGDAAIETTGGTAALTVSSGRAVYRDVDLQDGTIEFDVELTDHRSFVFVVFRAQGPGEHEEIYLRPHKSRLPDAVQYTPVYKGRSQWQLYHDPRSTAAAPLPAGEPVHVKIVVEGALGVVYVGDMTAPRLRFELARPPAPGHIMLSSFRPAGVPEDISLARFTNLSVRPGKVDPGLLFVAEAFRPPPGRIDRWLLSPAFAPAEGPVIELPPAIADDTDHWRPATVTTRGGFVEIERHVTRPEGARRAAVLARLTIEAAEATTRRLDLGFSDEISVFLNGRLIASANDSYSFNDPRRQGLLTLDQLAVYLPLEKGDNDLTVAVTDGFGGWGLAGRLEPLPATASGSRRTDAAPPAGWAPGRPGS